MNEHSVPREAFIAAIERQFWSMHSASRAEEALPAAGRKALLRSLRDMIVNRTEDFAQAIASDFGWRSHDETRMAEVVPSLTVIKHTLRNLRAWMRPERRSTAIHFWPARNRVHWQPKGLVLIVSPWNYPLYLPVGALAAALAAGNRVVVKPSEFAPATASLLKQTLEAALGPDRVSVVLGGADVAEALSRLPFDHILFTGSSAVGTRVMQAAAGNLTPVTLELGGKSPAIVHGDFDHALAARRIARGKLLNAGQTCIAPDYVLVHREKVDEFVERYRQQVADMYPRLIDNPDYTAIINEKHYRRLTGLLANARAKGARIVTLDPAREIAEGQSGAQASRKLLPALIVDPPAGIDLAREEIFGPVLPIVPYETIADAIAYVNARPRPLALYYFDTDRGRTESVLQGTVSGGATINDTVFHVAQADLPFGGIGPSGMGAYHGAEGFRTFSHAKGVFHQARWNFTELVSPPYGSRFRRLVRIVINMNGG